MNKKLLSGLALAFAIAIPAYFLGREFSLVGGPVFGILLGLLLAKIPRPEHFSAGISFTGKKVLQYAIILLGFQMNFYYVVDTGINSLAIMLLTIAAAFLTAYYLGRRLGIDRDITVLIGSGTAICGGSAIAAVAPVINAKDKDIAFSISTIFFFNVLAVFIFPAIAHVVGMDDLTFGMWAGTAINDTSSVVAAGYAYSDAAGEYATIVKLTRALMIIPVCLIIAAIFNRGKNFSLKKIFPMFILYFVIASIIATTGILPTALSLALAEVGKFMIVMAMVAIGLNTDLVKLVTQGGRPLLLGAATWAAVAVVALLLQGILL